MTARRPVATYTYRDEAGAAVYETVRYEPKAFRQRVPLGNGSYKWEVNGIRRVPYHLPDIVARMPHETVFVVEGEKDVEALRRLGFCATTNAGGANWKWTTEFAEFFRGAKRLVLLPDCDEGGEAKGPRKGREAALERAEILRRVCADVRLVDVDPNRHDGYDISDWLADGHDEEDLKALVEAAQPLPSVETTIPAQSNDGSRVKVTRADNVLITRVEWLAEGRIPLGGVTLFDGPGGVGKTTFPDGRNRRPFTRVRLLHWCGVGATVLPDRRSRGPTVVNRSAPKTVRR